MNAAKILPVTILATAALMGCAHDQGTMPTQAVTATPAITVPAPPPAAPVLAPSEQIRMDCIAGRRLICGKVLKVLPDGLVIDSGYTDLVRTPLTESWLIPATVKTTRNKAAIELKEPGTPCYGIVFLTDIPKRPKAKKFDYVVIMGYPAGIYNYKPLPTMVKPLRKFTAGLDTAVRLISEADTNQSGMPTVKGP